MSAGGALCREPRTGVQLCSLGCSQPPRRSTTENNLNRTKLARVGCFLGYGETHVGNGV
jgi:hypothetical protein